MRISVTLWKSEEKGIIIPGVGASPLVERIERRKTERSGAKEIRRLDSSARRLRKLILNSGRVGPEIKKDKPHLSTKSYHA